MLEHRMAFHNGYIAIMNAMSASSFCFKAAALKAEGAISYGGLSINCFYLFTL